MTGASHEPPPSPSESIVSAGNVASVTAVWEPLAKGESDDLQPFFDSLTEHVTLSTTAGELRGKDAVIRYFTTPSPDLTYNPFETPLEYYGAGGKVVIVGNETFVRPSTGARHRAPWAWVLEMSQGQVESILAIQDLSDISDVIVAKLRDAQEGDPRDGEAL